MSLFDYILWFRKPVQPKPPKPPKDHWAECSDSFYIHDYRSRLDTLVKEVHKDATIPIYTRFNPKTNAAEIVTEQYGVLAQVNVHGSEGLPYRAVVSLNPFLKPELYHQKFREMFGRLSVEFCTMQY